MLLEPAYRLLYGLAPTLTLYVSSTVDTICLQEVVGKEPKDPNQAATMSPKAPHYRLGAARSLVFLVLATAMTDVQHAGVAAVSSSDSSAICPESLDDACDNDAVCTACNYGASSWDSDAYVECATAYASEDPECGVLLGSICCRDVAAPGYDCLGNTAYYELNLCQLQQIDEDYGFGCTEITCNGVGGGASTEGGGDSVGSGSGAVGTLSPSSVVTFVSGLAVLAVAPFWAV